MKKISVLVSTADLAAALMARAFRPKHS